MKSLRYLAISLLVCMGIVAYAAAGASTRKLTPTVGTAGSARSLQPMLGAKASTRSLKPTGPAAADDDDGDFFDAQPLTGAHVPGASPTERYGTPEVIIGRIPSTSQIPLATAPKALTIDEPPLPASPLPRGASTRLKPQTSSREVIQPPTPVASSPVHSPLAEDHASSKEPAPLAAVVTPLDSRTQKFVNKHFAGLMPLTSGMHPEYKNILHAHLTELKKAPSTAAEKADMVKDLRASYKTLLREKVAEHAVYMNPNNLTRLEPNRFRMESSHTAIIQAKEEQLANYRTAFATAPADKKEFYNRAIKSLKSEISGLQNDARHLADYKTERRQQKLDQLAKKPTLFKERKAKADAKKAKIALAKAGIKAALTADFNAKNEQLKELKQAERPDEAKILEAEQQRNQALAQLESLAEKSFTKAQKRLAPSRLAVAVDSIKEKFEDVRQSIEMNRMRSQYGAHKIKGASKTAHDYRASWE